MNVELIWAVRIWLIEHSQLHNSSVKKKAVNEAVSRLSGKHITHVPAELKQQRLKVFLQLLVLINDVNIFSVVYQSCRITSLFDEEIKLTSHFSISKVLGTSSHVVDALCIG